DAGLDRLEHGVAGEGGGDRHHRPVRHLADLGAELGHGVEDRNAVHLAATAARRYTADDLRPVIEALAREVHGLAAGDPLDDEGGVLVDQRHGASVTSSEVRSSRPGAAP